MAVELPEKVFSATTMFWSAATLLGGATHLWGGWRAGDLTIMSVTPEQWNGCLDVHAKALGLWTILYSQVVRDADIKNKSMRVRLGLGHLLMVATGLPLLPKGVKIGVKLVMLGSALTSLLMLGAKPKVDAK